MLRWFATGKVDHPLAVGKESRRILQDLPKDTHKALGEIIFWLDSVNATAGFRLDRGPNSSRSSIKRRSCMCASSRRSISAAKFHEYRVWIAQAQYWRLVGAAYVQCIEGSQADGPGAGAIEQRLPVIVGRALHALGQQLKWLLLRYGPIDDRIWGDLGRMYAFAEAKGFAEAVIPLAEGVQAGSSARNDFVMRRPPTRAGWPEIQASTFFSHAPMCAISSRQTECCIG